LISLLPAWHCDLFETVTSKDLKDGHEFCVLCLQRVSQERTSLELRKRLWEIIVECDEYCLLNFIAKYEVTGCVLFAKVAMQIREEV